MVEQELETVSSKSCPFSYSSLYLPDNTVNVFITMLDFRLGKEKIS